MHPYNDLLAHMIFRSLIVGYASELRNSQNTGTGGSSTAFVIKSTGSRTIGRYNIQDEEKLGEKNKTQRVMKGRRNQTNFEQTDDAKLRNARNAPLCSFAPPL